MCCDAFFINMAPTIDIKAKLAITGPHNVKPVVETLRRQLGSVNIPIQVRIDPRSITGVNNLNKNLLQLNSTLKATRGLSDDLTYSVSKLGAAFGQIRDTKKLSREMQTTEQAIARVRKTTQQSSTEIERFGQSAAFAIRRFSAFTVAVGAVFGFVRAVQQATFEAISFEKQLIKIAQVQGSKANIESLANEITRLSVTLGVSSKDLVDVAQTLAQAGLSAKDTRIALEALAKSALAPTFNDIKNTTEAAIAAMAQFSLQAKDLESVIGSINSVAAAFATEAEDLTTVIRKTGAIFATAGSQLDDPKKQLNELLSLFTAVRSTTRESAETIATGFRTIFARLQRGDTIQFLRNFNIELLDTEGRFVGVFEAVRRLNAGLSGFQTGDIQFAEIIKQLAGRGEQISKVIPLIQQFPKALEALNIANKGTESLTRDQQLAQESLANALSRVKEEFLALVRSVTQTDTFKILASSILGVASALIKVADTIKPILPLITAFASLKLASAGAQFFSGFGRELKLGGGLGAVGSNTGRRITGRATGGTVPGSGNGDSVISALTPGEYVINKKAAGRIGINVLNKLNKFATGGPVGGSNKLVIGGGSINGPLEFNVKGAANAIAQFTKSLSQASINITQSELGQSPTGVAFGGGTHVSRFQSFPLSPISGERGLGKVSTETQVPLIGSPIVSGSFDRSVSSRKLRGLGSTSKGGFVNTIGGIPAGPGEIGLAEDRIPFDSVTENNSRFLNDPRTSFDDKGFGFRAPRNPLNLANINVRQDTSPTETSFSAGNRFGPQSKLGSQNPLGENAELLLKSSAALKKLPSTLSKYDDALSLLTKEIEKGVPTQKALQRVGNVLLKRSTAQLATEDGVASRGGLSKATLNKFGSAFNVPESVTGGPTRPSLLSRTGGRLRDVGGRLGRNVTSQQGVTAIGTGAFLLAGQLEGTGPVGSSVSTGLSTGLATGTLTAGLAGGPAGAVIGVTTGIVASLDRFLSETNRIASEVENTKFDRVLTNLADSLKRGATNVDSQIGEGRGSIDRQRELETSSGRSLNTLIGTGLGHVADFITGGQSIGGDSHADIGRTQGASGLIFEEFANLFGTQNRGNVKQDEERRLKEQGKLKELAAPQVESILKKIGGGASLSTVNISKEQRQLFEDAGIDFQKFIDADKIRQTQDSLANLISNIEVLGSQFDQLRVATEADISILDRFTKQQEEIASIANGSTRIGRSSSQAGTILDNIRGFGSSNVNAALGSVGANARTQSVISSGKRALEQVPGLFSRVNVSGNPGQAKANIVESVKGLKLDKAIEGVILENIEDLNITGDGETEFREKFKELADNLEGNIDKVLDPALKVAQTLAKKQEAAANAYIDGLNRIADAQSKLRDIQFEGADIGLEGRKNIADAQGRRLTDAEQRSSLTAKTSILGINSPNGLGSRIAGLRGQAASLSAARDNAAPGSPEFKQLSDKLASVNDELDRSQKALDLFSKDATLASIAAEKLSRVEEKRSVGREIAGGILGSDKLGTIKKVSALNRFQQGDLRPLVTNFEDLQSAIELQVKFLRAQGREGDARKVEQQFDAGIGEVLGPEFAQFFKSIRDEEGKARQQQLEAAKLQIQAAQETITAQKAVVQFFGGKAGQPVQPLPIQPRQPVQPRRARGGMVFGPGTNTSDSINAKLSDGEFVIRAAAVNKIGVDNLDFMNESGELPGFARGGAVRFRNRQGDFNLRRAIHHVRRVGGAAFQQQLNQGRANLSARRRNDRNGNFGGVSVASRGAAAFRGNQAGFNLRRAQHHARRVGGAAFQQQIAEGRAALGNRRRASRRRFATGGLVSGGSGVSISDSSLTSLNSFAIAANNLATALGSVNIPTEITLTGTHQVNVVFNGATVLNDLLNGPLAGMVRNEVERALGKYDRQLKG
jgi:TP901 family phage tail tape measure protein